MKFRFLSTALLELSESSDYYEKEIAGLGIEFLDEVESTIVRILKYPNAWGKLSEKFRHCNLRRFPFTIVYTQAQEDEILIVSVFHQSRKPGSWNENIQKS